MKPSTISAWWESEPAAIRLDNCRKMLAIHGFLTESENKKVRQRIRTWVDSNTPTNENGKSCGE